MITLAYPKTYRIVGYTYEADFHCVRCAEHRFGVKIHDDRNPPRDREGNPVTPVFLGDIRDDCRPVCGDCGEFLG